MDGNIQQAIINDLKENPPTKNGPRDISLAGHSVYVDVGTVSADKIIINGLRVTPLLPPPPPPAVKAAEGLDLTVDVPPGLANVIPVTQGTMDAIANLLGQNPVSASAMQRFVNNFGHRYGNVQNVHISDHGFHRTLHYDDHNGNTATVGLWAAHSNGSVRRNAKGVGNALEVLQRLCYVPRDEA